MVLRMMKKELQPIANPQGTRSLDQDTATEKTSVVAGRLVLGVAPQLVNRRISRCTENVCESLLTSGSLNSSGNCCVSQQVHLPSQQGNVLWPSSIFRIFCMKRIFGHYGGRVAPKVENCRRNVGTSTSSFCRRHGEGP